jgi:hypothetical protein
MSVSEKLKFKFHGNYGGPGYTAGKFYDSGSRIDWNVKPVDELDELFRKHDYDYDRIDHVAADQLFLQRLDALSSKNSSIKSKLAGWGFTLKSGRGELTSDNPDYEYPWESSWEPHHSVASEFYSPRLPQSKIKSKLLKLQEMSKQLGRRKPNKAKKEMKEIKKAVKQVARRQQMRPQRGPRPRTWYNKAAAKRFLLAPGKEKRFKAPVAYGFVRNMSNQYTFFKGRRPGCLGIHGKIYVGSLYAFQDAGSNVWGVLRQRESTSTASNFAITQWMVMPQNSFYVTGPLQIMSQMFERYEIKTKLTFKTNSTTTQPGALRFCYYDDPVAFYAQTGKTGSGTSGAPNYYPTFANAPTTLDIANSCSIKEGVIWKDFSTGWSHTAPKEDMKYIGANVYSSYMDPSFQEAIEMRQPIQGTWVISSTGLTGGGANTYIKLGEVWCTFSLELCDMMSAALTTNLTFRTPMKHSSVTNKMQGYMDEHEDLLKRLSVVEGKYKDPLVEQAPTVDEFQEKEQKELQSWIDRDEWREYARARKLEPKVEPVRVQTPELDKPKMKSTSLK